MQYLFPFTLIATFMFQIILCEINYCQELVMEPEEIYFAKKESLLIIQSDENYLQALNYGDYDIIQESMRIKNFGQEEIISAQIAKTNGDFLIFDKLICLFQKSDYYFISCIKESNINEKENFMQQNKLQTISNIKDDNKCDQFFIGKNSEFIIFCFQGFFLKLYNMDFENKTKLLMQFNIEQIMYTLCKRKYFQISDHHYLIAFIQCQNWGVFTYYDEKINVTLNEQIAQNIYSFQINYLENIDLCQYDQLFLITETSYFKFIIYENNSLSFQIVFHNFSNLKQLLFSQTCSIIYHIQYFSSDNKTVINKKNYQKEFEGTDLNFYLFHDVLFVQNKNQFQIIYDQQLQQVIHINHSQFYFENQFIGNKKQNSNFIYQIDLIANQILFYKFVYPRSFVKPSKKYIILISSQSLYQSYNFLCFEIKYNLKAPQLIQTLDFINNCQKQSIIFLDKQSLNLMNKYQIKLPLNSDLNINILDYSSFDQICQELKIFLHTDQILLYYENDNQQSFSVIKTKNYFHYQTCDGQFLYRIKTQEFQVFQYRSSIILWQKDKKILRISIYQASQPLNFEYRFRSEIINIQQFQNIVIVFTKNGNELQLFDLCTTDIVVIDPKIKNILSNLNQRYLQTQQENQQFQAFYFSKYQPQFIQFYQYLIIDNHLQFNWLEIGFIQIVILRVINSKLFILGVHLINNIIIEQYLVEDQILILNKNNLNDYEIIRPLEYQINDNYFAIATRKLAKTYILLFVIQPKFPLKQEKIIEVGRIQFFFQQRYLYYYDQEDNICKYNTRDFEIQLDNPFPQQNDDTNLKKINFQIVSLYSNDSAKNVEITIRSYNKCFKLFRKQNDDLLMHISKKELKININDYIYGPIDDVQIINDSYIKIEGPLLLSEIINNLEILEDIKIQTINLESYFPDIQNIINIIQFQSNLIILFEKSSQNQIKDKKLLQNIIPLNNKSLLFLFLENNRQKLVGIIYMIDETTLQLVIKTQLQLCLYTIFGNSIKQIYNHLNILGILKIKGNNDLYISFSTENSLILFQILSLDQFLFQVKGMATLSWNTMEVVLKNHIDLHSRSFLNQDYQIFFLECSITDEKTFQEYSAISEIIIMLEDLKISYKPIKILRNHEQLNILDFDYLSQNKLILKQSNFLYFYDLTEQLNLYDYIGRQPLDRQYVFHQFNTTHFIVYDCKQQKIFIADIGYQIKVNDEVLENKFFTLIAKNTVSSIQVEISLEEFNDKIQSQYFLTTLFFIFFLLLVFYFLTKRMQLKNKFMNFQKQGSITQNNLES